MKLKLFNNTATRAGFTLLEILLVVAAIAILAGIVIFAVNPRKQLADTRNAQRRVDVNTILNAVHQYALDNNGAYPSGLSTGTTFEICKTDAQSCSGFLDLASLTTNAKYLTAMPIDPSGTTDNGTRYSITVEATSNRVTVTAPNAENNTTISVTR
jgi:type IV pilus assembly protein PilA